LRRGRRRLPATGRRPGRPVRRRGGPHRQLRDHGPHGRRRDRTDAADRPRLGQLLPLGHRGVPHHGRLSRRRLGCRLRPGRQARRTHRRRVCHRHRRRCGRPRRVRAAPPAGVVLDHRFQLPHGPAASLRPLARHRRPHLAVVPPHPELRKRRRREDPGTTSTAFPQARPLTGRDSAGLDGPASDAILRAGRFFRRGEASEDLRTVTHAGGRESDVFYRDRWSHDKVVRSTHGVNCTGSCSWKVYVKEGIITWEAQQTDYPDIGDDLPGYEPRGCPRGAAFSWYTYSPTRVRYPYIRGRLMELWRAARAEHADPVDAWASIVEDEQKTAYYKRARGKGGLVRCRWEDAVEIAAAAHVYTAKTVGP